MKIQARWKKKRDYNQQETVHSSGGMSGCQESYLIQEEKETEVWKGPETSVTSVRQINER